MSLLILIVVLTWLSLSLITPIVDGFYLPGMAPQTYCKLNTSGFISRVDSSLECREDIDVYVNRLTSINTVAPYDYHTFDFCKVSTSEEEEKSPAHNLGQLMFGERIRPSLYQLKFKKEEQCKLLCTKTYDTSSPVDVTRLRFLQKAIQLNYYHHWVVDNMPVALCYDTVVGDSYCSSAFPMGCFVTEDGTPQDACALQFHKFSARNTAYVFNHVDFEITYHSAKGLDGLDSGRIVGVRANVKSIRHSEGGDVVECGNIKSSAMALPMDFKKKERLEVKYTYSVKFTENNNIRWSSRWDSLLSVRHSTVQWFSVINSGVLILILSIIQAVILRSALKGKDTDNETFADTKNKLRWKLLSGDVFRTPRHPALLSAAVANGLHIFLVSLLGLLVGFSGMLSPANRGARGTCFMYLYVLFSAPAGYVSARIYSLFNQDSRKKCAVLTPLLFSGCVFAMVLLLDTILRFRGSSGAMPFWTIVTIIALWLCLSVPLSIFGSFMGFRRKAPEIPGVVKEEARDIPRACATSLPVSALLGGVLPFSCLFIQLFFVLNSIWNHVIYHNFGMLLLVFGLYVVATAEATVVLCYFHLRAEDYRWWWRSFKTAGFTGVYVFSYSLYFLLGKTALSDGLSVVLYIGYSLIMAAAIFLLSGTIGFLSCRWFVFKIYGGMKWDN